MNRTIISFFIIWTFIFNFIVFCSAEELYTNDGSKIIHIKGGEGNYQDDIKPGESNEYDIDKDITPDDLVILSLSNLGSDNGKFNYLTLQNKTTGLIVCKENKNGLSEGGHYERSRIRYFTVEDPVHTRYKVIVSTERLVSYKPIQGKIKFNPNVINIFDNK